MEIYILYSILSYLFWPALIIGIIYLLVRRRKRDYPSKDKDWYTQVALSKEDAVSQSLFSISLFFLGVTFFALNKDFGSPVSLGLILFATSAVALFTAYRYKVLFALALGLIGVIIAWSMQTVEWTQNINMKSASIILGIVFMTLTFFILGRIHEKEIHFKRFSLVYLLFGIFPITVFFFFFSTKFGLSFLSGITSGAAFFSSWQTTMLLLLLFVVFVGVSFYALKEKLISVTEASVVALIAVLFVTIAFLPEQKTLSGSYSIFGSGVLLSPAGFFWAALFNVIIFAELVGLILLGYVRKENWLINLGALFLFLLVIVKYFDWFFTFLDKSVFYIGAGVLLLFVGWFMEKGRRYMIAQLSSRAQ